MQKVHAEFMAFLRMKLSSQNVVLPDSRCKFVAVCGGGQDIFMISAANMIRMNEIESRRFLISGENSGSVQGINNVPSHMGDFESILSLIKFEAPRFRLDPSQPVPSSLFASFGHQLHAQTDA